MHTQKSTHRVLNYSTMTAFQRHIVKRGKRNAVTGFFRSKDDKAAIATWRLDLEKLRQVFDVRPFTSLSHDC